MFTYKSDKIPMKSSTAVYVREFEAFLIKAA